MTSSFRDSHRSRIHFAISAEPKLEKSGFLKTEILTSHFLCGPGPIFKDLIELRPASAEWEIAKTTHYKPTFGLGPDLRVGVCRSLVLCRRHPMITSPRPVALFELGRQGKSCQTFRLHTVRMSSIGLARGTIFSFFPFLIFKAAGPYNGYIFSIRDSRRGH